MNGRNCKNCILLPLTGLDDIGIFFGKTADTSETCHDIRNLLPTLSEYKFSISLFLSFLYVWKKNVSCLCHSCLFVYIIIIQFSQKRFSSFIRSNPDPLRTIQDYYIMRHTNNLIVLNAQGHPSPRNSPRSDLDNANLIYGAGWVNDVSITGTIADTYPSPPPLLLLLFPNVLAFVCTFPVSWERTGWKEIYHFSIREVPDTDFQWNIVMA